MPAGYYTAADGLSMAYSVSGDGLGLVLLHGGFVQDREVWHRLGYVRALAEEYRVVTIDLRGHGSSDRPSSPEELGAERVIGDVLGIADMAGLSGFYLWGFSLGGSVAIQTAALSSRVQGLVAAGSFFSPALQAIACGHRDRIDELMPELDGRGAAELGFDADERFFVENVDLGLARSWYAAMCDWPRVGPADLQCPAVVLTGENDLPVRQFLEQQREEMERARVELRVFPDLDHFGLLDRKDAVLPVVRSVLHHWALA